MGGSNSSMNGGGYEEHRTKRKNYEPCEFGNLRRRVPEDSVQRVHVSQSYAERPRDYERRSGSYGRQNSSGRNEAFQSHRVHKEKAKDYGPKTFASLKRRPPADTKPQNAPERIIGFTMPTEEGIYRKQNGTQDRRIPTATKVREEFPKAIATLVEPEPVYMPEVEMANEVTEEPREEYELEKEEEETPRGKRIASVLAPIVGAAVVAEVAESISGPAIVGHISEPVVAGGVDGSVLGGGAAVREPNVVMDKSINPVDYGWVVSNASQKEGDFYEDNEAHETHGEKELAKPDYQAEEADFNHRLSTVQESEEEIMERGAEPRLLEDQQEEQLQKGGTTEDSEDGTAEDQTKEVVTEPAEEAAIGEQEEEGPVEESTMEPTEVEVKEEIPGQIQSEEQAEQVATEEQDRQQPKEDEQYEEQAEETPEAAEAEEVPEEYAAEEAVEETVTEKQETERPEESEQYEEQTVETEEAGPSEEPAEQEVVEDQTEQTEQPQEELESMPTESENY